MKREKAANQKRKRKEGKGQQGGRTKKRKNESDPVVVQDEDVDALSGIMTVVQDMEPTGDAS